MIQHWIDEDDLIECETHGWWVGYCEPCLTDGSSSSDSKSTYSLPREQGQKRGNLSQTSGPLTPMEKYWDAKARESEQARGSDQNPQEL